METNDTSWPGKENPKAEANQPDSKKLIGHIKGFFKGIWDYVHHFFHIKEDIDVSGTLKEIKKGLDFGGARAWILMAAIFMAAVGLNIGQFAIAVIIGAMLVAPLMAPILGTGVSLGTNDWKTLKKSTVSLTQAVVISLIGSMLWFIISPINSPSDALTVRTIPTIFDVVIAICGGIACIISFSLKDKSLASTVIPGVAVGTSLMPPLATAGYGIAHWDATFFYGGFYLFLINAIFIALPAYVFVKMMKFPKVTQEDAATERKHKLYLGIGLAVILIPSIWVFVGVVKDSVFNADVDDFVDNVVQYDGANMIDYKSDRETNTLEVFMLGEIVPDDVQTAWRQQLDDYGLEDTKFTVSQAKNMTGDIAEDHLSAEFIEDLYAEKDIQLHEKDDKIAFLESQLANVNQLDVPLLEIEKEIQINYNNVLKLSYNESMELNFDGKVDTIPTFIVKWKEGYEGVEEDSKRLVQWLSLRLKVDSPRIVNH
jgi:uncharacterized hydrophobic protein (TIGR00271 family)